MRFLEMGPDTCHDGVVTTGSTGSRYPAVERWLRQRCLELPPGSQLPTEAEAAQQFMVSRMTARRAYQRLADQGFLERRQGAGSFVLAPPLHRPESVIRPFSDDMRRRGLSPRSKVLRAEIGSSPEAAIALGLDATQWVVMVDRVRYADDVPIALDSTCLPTDFAAVLDADLENGSLYHALTTLGRTMARATGYVTARLASTAEATELNLPMPAALLEETRLSIDDNGRRVETTKTAYVGSRWAIDTGAYIATSPSLPGLDSNQEPSD